MSRLSYWPTAISLAPARFVLMSSLSLSAFFTMGTTLAADNASGTIAYKSRTATLKHVYLIKGPDAVDPKVTVRELIISSADIGAKLNACKTMSCVSGILQEGMTVDFGPGPRLNYWVVLNNQMVQYSGTAVPAALSATQNDANRLAGTLRIDDTTASGSRVEVTFDVGVTKEFGAAR